MRKSKIYINRLIVLAGRLLDNQLDDENKQYCCDSKGANIEYFSWALKDIPVLFKQWEYGPDGSPRLDGYESLNTLTAAAIWFGLDFDSLSHLFVPGFQEPTIYRGKTLSDTATPIALVSNMYEYINIIESKTEARIINIKTQKNEKSNRVSRMRA